MQMPVKKAESAALSSAAMSSVALPSADPKSADPKSALSPTSTLSAFLASIRYEDLPQPVVARTEELFLDWMASALAGKGARPVEIMNGFAAAMGPQEGGRRKSADPQTHFPVLCRAGQWRGFAFCRAG